MMIKVKKSEKVISSFRGEYGFLSNYHESPIYINNVKYKSVEHAYQAHKSANDSVRELVRNAKTPNEAKKLGRSIQIREDWELVKFDMMKSFVRKKFENPFLRDLLLATGDAELVNNNSWNDTTWGVCKGIGKNLLGKILMDVRNELLEESCTDESDFGR